MKGKEARGLLGCTRSALSLYVSKGIVRAERKPNGRYDYSEEDVRQLMQKKADKHDFTLADQLVSALGYSIEALRSEDRSRELSDRRRVIATMLHKAGYTHARIARFLSRKKCSVSAMLRTSYLANKELAAAELRWEQAI